MSKISQYIWGGVIIKLPFVSRNANLIYRKLGVELHSTARLSRKVFIHGEYSNIRMCANSEINIGCFLLSTDKIIVGENSVVAYNAIILTSANPNSPCNTLSQIYKPITAPVVIGKNCWIGAGAIILPGVEIGDFSVVAAGSVVTKNVPSGTMVAGNPAKVKKYLRNE